MPPSEIVNCSQRNVAIFLIKCKLYLSTHMLLYILSLVYFVFEKNLLGGKVASATHEIVEYLKTILFSKYSNHYNVNINVVLIM